MSDKDQLNKNITPLDLGVKDLMRQFFQGRMNMAKHQGGLAVVPGILIREEEMEKFIDEQWIFINKDQHNGTN